jgi:serine/threonine protein kinase
MEYLEGRTLRRFIEENATRSIAFGIEVMRQTCRGVAHAHEHGIVHRDLKPDNLMLGNASDGSLRVKLLDFGIARRIMSVDTRLTPTGTELGTAHYMAPEQARGVKAVGPASDVYSLGVIFYELLTGERPHPGDTYNAVMFHLLTQPPLPLATVMPSCPEAVRDVVERCLAQRPDARYPTAKELLSALDELPEQPADGQPASVTESAVRTTKRNVLKPFLLGAGTGVAVSLLVVWLLSVGAGADAAIASGTAPRGEFGAATTTPLGAPRSEGPANEAAKITVEKHEPEESPGGLEPRRPPPASKAPLPRRLTSAAAPTARRGTVAPAPSSASAPSAVPRATAPVASSFGFVVRNPYD